MPKKKKLKGLPTIADLRRTVPAKGLLDPSLREGKQSGSPTLEQVYGKRKRKK